MKKKNSIMNVQDPNQTIERIIVESNPSPLIKNKSKLPKKEIQIKKSASEIIASPKNKEKMPSSIRNLIVKKALGQTLIQTSKTIRMINTLSLERKFICGICQCEYERKMQGRIGKCCHSFCTSCLSQYLIYKVEVFDEVFCPQQNCQQKVDEKSTFYNHLPIQIQKKYKKNLLFHLTTKDSSLRLCPNEKCEDGILSLKEDTDPECPSCKKIFCKKCMFPQHNGNCEKYQVDFFQNNLKYRQCSQCKRIVQLRKGCNHIKCKCGHEFCYECGKDWDGNGHICLNQVQVKTPTRPFNCLNGIDTRSYSGKVTAFFVKIGLLFPLFSILLALKISLLLLIFLLGVIVGPTLKAIFFGYCELFDKVRKKWVKYLMLIFLPIAMIIGWFMLIRESFLTIFQPALLEVASITIRNMFNFFCW